MAKPDPAHRATDELLAWLEKDLSELYAEAAKDLTEKAADYFRRFEAKDKTWQEWVKNGTKTEAEYRQWRTGQMAVGEMWEAKRDEMARSMVEADRIAAQMVNAYTPAVYAENHNYGTWEVESQSGVDTSYTLYNRDTVARILREDPDLLPGPGLAAQERIDAAAAIGKDLRWNRQHIQSAVIQGIVQGESIPEIARRMEQVAEMDHNAAIRNARTAITGAENAGKMDSYYRAQEMGIQMRKCWIATLDNRTRDAHRELDGEVVDLDDPFENEIGKIMFPGDPSADPANVYNCFVGNTKIASDCEIIRSYKYDYSGKFVTIKTAGGVNFTCTPNHPILTVFGWVRAESLKNGDHLLVAMRQKDFSLGVNPNVNHAFPSIETVHKFFDIMGGERTSSLRVNFHGDIPASDVEIITQKRFLRGNDKTSVDNSCNKFGLVHSDKPLVSERPLMQHFLCVLRSALGFVCSKGKAFALVRRGLGHSEIHSLRPVALFNSGGIKALDNDVSGNVELLRQSLDGFTGVVFADNIISVDISSGSSHVYNLQTEKGYYFVNSSITQNTGKDNCIFAIAHNCRCTMISQIKGFERDPADLGLRNTDHLEGVSYDEWKKGHGQSRPITTGEEISESIRQSYLSEYRRP